MARRSSAPAESLRAEQSLLGRKRSWSRAALTVRADGLRYGAVVACAYAAFLHDVVVPEHAVEWWGYGVFFVLTTALQFFYAGALLFWLAAPLRRFESSESFFGRAAPPVLPALARFSAS